MKWLIDGHNLIGQMPNLQLDDPDDEEKLLEQLRRYRARTGHSLTVIFDPGQGYRLGQTKKQGGLTIQFAPSGKTADEIIMQRLRRVKDPQAVMVVSSDRSVQRVAQQVQVRVLDSREFARQLLPGKSTAPDLDAGSRADVSLSPNEVDEWLDIFNQSNS
jgi:predicted RNA-binding protein with PIN domain